MDEFLISMVGLQENQRLQTGIIIKPHLWGQNQVHPILVIYHAIGHDLKDLAARTLVG